MRPTLIICLCFATHLLADGITSSNSATSIPMIANDVSAVPNTTSSAPFDEDAELAKIAASCLSSSNFEELAGNIVRGTLARILGVALLRATVDIIGLTELRASLNLAPLPPWQHYNMMGPSESDLASAPTIQAYYDLKEPRSEVRSLDSEYLYEKNLPAAIAYLDKRLPSIRIIFRRKFEEIRRSGVQMLDRKAIDGMIDEFFKIRGRVNKAVWQMQNQT